MRENRPCGSEGGEAQKPSLPLSLEVANPCDRKSSGEENEHDVLKPFNAIQRV